MIKLRGQCENCRKMCWLPRKRKVSLPIGGTATSQMALCGTCITKLNKALNP